MGTEEGRKKNLGELGLLGRRSDTRTWPSLGTVLFNHPKSVKRANASPLIRRKRVEFKRQIILLK